MLLRMPQACRGGGIGSARQSNGARDSHVGWNMQAGGQPLGGLQVHGHAIRGQPARTASAGQEPAMRQMRRLAVALTPLPRPPELA